MTVTAKTAWWFWDMRYAVTIAKWLTHTLEKPHKTAKSSA